MSEPKQETKVIAEKEIIEDEKIGFDYKNKASFKISQKFKQYFSTKTAGGETISNDGLVALAHVKGIWKLDCNIIQFPNADNNNTCICQATVGGYDWDPIENKIIRVEFSDIGDASPSNCNRMVAPSFIRMASTRAIGRALRKYTNIDMLCTEELGDEDVSTTSMIDMASESRISMEQLNTIKDLFIKKHIDQNLGSQMLINTFGINDFQMLSAAQGNQFIQLLVNYISPTQ